MPRLTLEPWEVNYINKMAACTARAEGRRIPRPYRLADLRWLEALTRTFFTVKTITIIDGVRYEHD